MHGLRTHPPMMARSTKLARYTKLIFFVIVLWVILTYGPSPFFQSSLSHDTDSEVPFGPPPSPTASHHDFDPSHEHPPNQQFFGINERKSKGKPEHHYRDDGLVEVNPEAPHPIFELIQKAEKEWEEKKKRASTTLDEAIIEYKRRYKRNPPKGFDQWCVFQHFNMFDGFDESDTFSSSLFAL